MALLDAKSFMDKMENDGTFRQQVVHSYSSEEGIEMIRRAGFYFTENEYDEIRKGKFKPVLPGDEEPGRESFWYRLGQDHWLNQPFSTEENEL